MTDRIDTSPAAIAALLECVTPGPWYHHMDGFASSSVRANCNTDPDAYDSSVVLFRAQCHGAVSFAQEKANTSFAAAARELVPAISAERDALTARAEAAEAEVARLTAELDALRVAQDALVAAAYEAAVQALILDLGHLTEDQSMTGPYALRRAMEAIRRPIPADAVAALAAYARAERNKARLAAAERMRLGGLHTIDDRAKAILAMIEKE